MTALLLLLLLTVAASIFSQIIPGLCDDPTKSAQEVEKPESHSSSKELKVLYACLGVTVFVLLSVFLFKMWQKKKREEQHARLLKLFEEDDELEVELGLRD